jgi:8-oxo-dGTP pyrophosphatase MutT (NUDIX family)
MHRQLPALFNLPHFDAATAQRKMAPLPRPARRPETRAGQPRIGAVMVLLYCRYGQMHLALTKRPDTLRDHSGQVSFPGGKQDAGETLAQTALRETFEEVGVVPAAVEIVGELTPLYIPPTDFEVHPFVGWHAAAPRFVPNSAEVARILEVPIAHLLQPTTQRHEKWQLRGYELDVPFYDVEGFKVWGATAMMLSEFLGRWRAAGLQP